MKFVIYALLCPKCGCPRYVGQTSEFEARIKNHMKGMECRDDSIYKKHWVQKLLDQDLKPIVRVLLELLDASQLDAAEIYWTSELRRRGCPLTNLTDGGGGLRGYKNSPETIEKRMRYVRGVPKSQATKDKISAALMGRPSPKKGRPLTPEEKISHAAARVVPPFRDQHGRIYRTIKEAADRWKLPAGNIIHCLKGRRKSVGGLEFRYC